MITIYEWNAEGEQFQYMGLGSLHEAQEIRIKQDITGDYRLVFEYPMTSEKYGLICENRIVQYQGQIFRINRREERQETLMALVNAMHIYSDTEDHHSHVPKIKNYMGYTPYQIMTGPEMKKELDELGFHVLTPAEVEKLGMEWLDQKIDFWAQDKTNANKVMRTIVENAGWGEIYKDNRNLAIVKRIGKDKGLRLDVKLNMVNPEKYTEITGMVTRLYPYGQNDLPITSVNNGKPYIDSPNIETYGVRKGFMDYSDVESAGKLLERAKWEFDERNEERIDVPALTIEARALDLSVLPEYSKMPNIRIGDTVHLYSKELELNGLKQRITSMEWYPEEPEKSIVRIGRVKKNLLYYVMHTDSLIKRFDKATNTNGDTKTNWLQGDINTDRNMVVDQDKVFTIDGSLLEILDPDTKLTRVELGCVERKGKKIFVFTIYGKDGQEAIYMDENGDAVFSGAVNTQKDSYVGQYLYVGQGMDDGCIYISSTNDPKAASIRNTANGETIISGNKGGDIVFGDRGICIGADAEKNVIATQGQIDKLEAEILNLKKEIAEIKK